ncbi:unnamed protein product [Chondrus crispus]|uniref:Uncharacterized protein n=1 Tax=Chondrus crispus TaxID=2769 RepID=S0F3U2_CHOCR|nr:unnamed protein product [Chondrus crispus]CDF77428.1 unnamed protein product [Chondrus crispus]|eukprot:XP_005712302.1 unnamed protein product [Chondrus crispus]
MRSSFETPNALRIQEKLAFDLCPQSRSVPPFKFNQSVHHHAVQNHSTCSIYTYLTTGHRRKVSSNLASGFKSRWSGAGTAGCRNSKKKKKKQKRLKVSSNLASGLKSRWSGQ